MSDDRPEFDGQSVFKGHNGKRESLLAAGVTLARVAQYLITTLAAIITYSALEMNALESAVLGVYVLVLLGFVVVGELVVVRPLKERGRA